MTRGFHTYIVSGGGGGELLRGFSGFDLIVQLQFSHDHVKPGCNFFHGGLEVINLSGQSASLKKNCCIQSLFN